MAISNTRTVRRHKRRTDDGKGLRRMIAGRRFRVPAGIEAREAEKRFARIEDVWRDNESYCRDLGRDAEWTEIALWAAEAIRRGELRVPLPRMDDILSSFGSSDWPHRLTMIIEHYTSDDGSCHYPRTVDGLEFDQVMHLHDVVSERFPTVNWLLPEAHSDDIVKFHENAAKWSLRRVANAKGLAPPDPTTPLIDGSFHEAITAYEEKRTKDFTLPDGRFDGSGHHMLGMIQAIREQRPDFPLAELDFTRCQELIDRWRERPISKRTKMPMARKTCQGHIGELLRFLGWLHLDTNLGWRKPPDFGDLNTEVKKLPTDRKSIKKMEIQTFSVEELTLLYKYANRFQRLLMVWCLNCAHGAAEFGRVEWEDLFLQEEHPWKREGLQIESSEADSWCGLLRPKTDVLGWWYLWPETVMLLDWWRGEVTKTLGREPSANDRILITDTGAPLYRDESRNAQSGFANSWTRLRNYINKHEEKKIRRLPFGTLRDQLSNWLGGDENKAVVASVALCHGIPHKGDKLLYRHYSNRPWGTLFQNQRKYRGHLREMFDALPSPLAEFDPLTEKVEALWKTGEREISKFAEFLGVHEETVRRRLKASKLI